MAADYSGISQLWQEIVTARTLTVALVILSGAVAALWVLRHHERDALRRIVQTQCVPHYLRHGDPTPCERVVLSVGQRAASGYAILHDRKGGVHELLIPVRTVSGIESPVLLDPNTPDYVAAAWRNRDGLDALAGRTLRREEVGLAINPRTARGQDQFHIHMECIGTPLRTALSGKAESLSASWTPLEVAGHRFQARRLNGEMLDATPVMHLLASEASSSGHGLDNHTLVVAGQHFASGPGFVLLTAAGALPGETLLDAGCPE